MATIFKPKKEELAFLPLGGAGEIGLNCYLYHYKGKWLIIDLGIGFADHTFPGVEILVPDIQFLIANKKDIAGMVLTHAHEDHIGAVPYLWPELGCEIYTTKFTASIVKGKLADVGLSKEVKITEVPENGKFKVGPFDLEFFGLTHSVPEMQGFALKTEEGTIFHTGDWKFDSNPLIGKKTDQKRLKKLGDEGVLALVCDSTNIFQEGSSGSEGELEKSFEKLIGGFNDQLLVVTSFASNIARLYSIAKAAKKVGRRVGMIGRSLWRMYEAAKQCGYLEDLDPFLTDKEFKKYKRSELLVICTGCQGEPLAASRKLADNEHPSLRLQKGDVIIFSSKIIPGNEKKIFELFNKFCKMGIEVLTENDHFVHVSGHPARDEVAKMYSLLRPKIAIPVHGEAMHLHEHCKFAKEHGAKYAKEIENGHMVKISQSGVKELGLVPTSALAIDGNFMLPYTSNILRMRRRMRDDGLVVITLLLEKNGSLLKPPIILAPGVLDAEDDYDILENIANRVESLVNGGRNKGGKQLVKAVEEQVKKIVKQEAGKKPYVIAQVSLI